MKTETQLMHEILEFNQQVANDQAGEIVARIVSLKAQLEAVKPLYEELDNLTVQLASIKSPGSEFQVGEDTVTLVDNFAEKNTVFRPTGVKRFEVQVENTIEKLAKEEKRAKRAKK